MKRFVYKLFLFGLIVIFFAYLTDYCLTFVFHKGNTKKAQWLYSKPGTSYDVAILGSSRSWWNINMNTFNKELGINSINLCDNHFPNVEMLLRIKQFYAYGNTVDILLIQTEYWSLFDHDRGFSNTVYDNIPFLDDTTTYNYLSARSNEWIKLKYVPLWRYSEYNKLWGVEEFLITLLGMRNTAYDSTGTFLTNNKFYGIDSVSYSRADSFKINSDFLTLLEFCKKHNIKVSIFTAPIFNANIHEESQRNMEKQLHAMDIDYHNYINIFNDSIFFNDNIHLSLHGGKVFTDTLINQTKHLLENPLLE